MSSHLAREIIFALGDNMREGLEPLLTKTLAPSLYQVYLHADDYDRLSGIFREIEIEAKAYLDRELEALNRSSAPVMDRLRDRLPGRLAELAGDGGSAEVPMRHVPAGGEWHIRFQEDPNEELEPGEIEVVSELSVGEQVSYGSGRATHRIEVSTTRRLRESSSKRTTVATEESSGDSAPGAGARYASDSGSVAVVDAPSPSAASCAPVTERSPAATEPTRATSRSESEEPTQPVSPVLATLDYRDNGGERRFFMTKEEITLGRGAVDVWVDLRLDTLPDVSRRHARIRYENSADRFWIEDLSQFGLNVDGKSAPSGGRVELADGSNIDLAGVVTLTFHRGG